MKPRSLTLVICLALFGRSSAAASNVLRRSIVLNAPVAGIPSDPSTAAALRRVEDGVKALKVPGKSQPVAREAVQKVAGTSGCRFLGGLVTAELSKQCCTNIQVVTQRQLNQHGVAQKCQTNWQCESDGQTPSQKFETQALSSLCGEPGCLPSVVVAVKSNPVTMRSADNIGNICSTLASIGGSKASPAAVSKILTGAGRGRAGKGGRSPANGEGEKEGAEDSPFCFPGEAIAIVQGKGDVSVAKLRTGDMVLVASQGHLAYEPILAFLHARKNSDAALPFVTIMHVGGMIRASASHIVFVATGSGWTSKLAAKVQVGDSIFVAGALGDTWDAKPSRVLAIQRSGTRLGMYAPLTSSGTIVVDGVLASTYASPSDQKDLSHQLAHAFLLPVRIYHYLGLSSRLQPIWQNICSTSSATRNWLCQGGGIPEGEYAVEHEELHPYMRVTWRGLKLSLLL